MQYNIYFRKDNWERFKDEVGKSNLVNQLLAKHYGLDPHEITVDDRPIPKEYITHTFVPKPFVPKPFVPKPFVPKPFVPKPPDPELGYPCCQKAKPCKHWLWNGEQGAWINELTGKIKETI